MEPQKQTRPPSAPTTLRGTWVSEKFEEFIISSTVITYKMGGKVQFSGTFANHKADSPDSAYITIRYTENSAFPGSAPGKFYVLRLKNITSAGISFILAFNVHDPDSGLITSPIGPSGGGAGKITREEAEAVYTDANGYFSGDSSCYKITGTAKYSNTPLGTWENSNCDYFTITEQAVVYSWVYQWGFIGVIVNVRGDGEEGFITFRYIENSFDPSLEGKYCVLRWKNRQTGSVDISIANKNNPGDEGLDKKSATEAEYTLTNPVDYYWDIDSCTRPVWL